MHWIDSFCHLTYQIIRKLPSSQIQIENSLTTFSNVFRPVQFIWNGFSFSISCFTNPVAQSQVNAKSKLIRMWHLMELNCSQAACFFGSEQNHFLLQKNLRRLRAPFILNKQSMDSEVVSWRGMMVNKHRLAKTENLHHLVDKLRYSNKINCSYFWNSFWFKSCTLIKCLTKNLKLCVTWRSFFVDIA